MTDRPFTIPSFMMGAAAALVADLALGEPPDRVHPVAALGHAMLATEKRIYGDNRSAGIAYAGIGIGIAGAAGLVFRRVIRSPFVSTGVVATVAIAGRMLAEVAESICEPLIRDDLETAREAVVALVGRRPDTLNGSDIARAVVESVAENAVDAVIAPAFWAALCGPVGAAVYRAINTLDAMVGHHSTRYERFGWASARLDDIANWVPARITAALVMAVRPQRWRDILHAVRHDAPAHPSPNSGVAEAAFAAALNVQLGGVNDYGDRIEDRGTLGRGRLADPAAIGEATALLRDITATAAALLLATALITNALARTKNQ